MEPTVEISQEFPISAKELFSAWLDSKTHSEMTGGEAQCSSKEGGAFTAWDGYIQGTNLSLNPHSEIIQKWRSADFKPADEDSILKIQFKDAGNGCILTLIHSNIPKNQPDYYQGWIDNYLIPMKHYFETSADQ